MENNAANTEVLECKIISTIFYNEIDGYAVFRAATIKGGLPLTIRGYTTPIEPGTEMKVTGSWIVDKKYGRQFSASLWETFVPTSREGLIKFLSSASFKGIGPVYAVKLVDYFGQDILTVIDKTPERLLEIKGIGEGRVEKIKNSWKQHEKVRDIMIFLQTHGVTNNVAVPLYNKYGDSAVAVLKENPYRMIDDIFGIGFKKADDIALKLGIDRHAPIRCNSGIRYVLLQDANLGNVYVDKDMLIDKCVELLGITKEEAAIALNNQSAVHRVIDDQGKIYHPTYYGAENNIAKCFRRLSRATAKPFRFDITGLDTVMGIRFDPKQQEAVMAALLHPVMILTGGPGTGKSTITKAILKAYDRAHLNYVLAAPTGRAAKRLSEVTGCNAQTIHRLLNFTPNGFQRNEDNPIEADAVVIDESSMIDTVLMSALLSAIQPGTRLLLIGDADQLPSVGAGNCLCDLIESGVVHTVRLTTVFRQAKGSPIIDAAHSINNSYMPRCSASLDDECVFIDIDDPADIEQKIIDLATKEIPARYRIPAEQIQILSPMKVRNCGTEILNGRIQKCLNRNKPFLSTPTYAYAVGDKVMQTRNNYDKLVFNGDLGYIRSYDEEDKVATVEFDGRFVQYELFEFNELVLAYAITVHKSQGGEFPVVIAPVTKAHFMLLYKELCYTCVTRAKSKLILVGQKSALAMALKRRDVHRNTTLKERLLTCFEKEVG